MKFVNSILTLLATSYVFSASSEENINELCLKELNPYNSCLFNFQGITESELAQHCKNYKNKNCNDFFNNPYKYAPT